MLITRSNFSLQFQFIVFINHCYIVVFLHSLERRSAVPICFAKQTAKHSGRV